MDIFESAKRVKYHLLTPLDRREKIHFLHIGKNAGTQISIISQQINKAQKNFRIVKHSHGSPLRNLPENEKYFFSIRSPESRFKSAFYSRKRQGRPRIYEEWSIYEKKAFNEFDDANDLAESLFEPGPTGFRALCAIKSITHCSMDQINWFDRCGYFFEINPPLSIIRQEHFEKDLGMLFEKIGFDKTVLIERDPVAAHRNDYSDTPPLSEKAKKNLYEWYRQDFDFYEKCEQWINESIQKPRPVNVTTTRASPGAQRR